MPNKKLFLMCERKSKCSMQCMRGNLFYWKKGELTTKWFTLIYKNKKLSLLIYKSKKLNLILWHSNIMLVVVWMPSVVIDDISMTLDNKRQFQRYKLDTNLNGKMKGIDQRIQRKLSHNRNNVKYPTYSCVNHRQHNEIIII